MFTKYWSQSGPQRPSMTKRNNESNNLHDKSLKASDHLWKQAFNILQKEYKEFTCPCRRRNLDPVYMEWGTPV